METQIIIAYCICDDIVKKSKIREQRHKKLSLSEVITTALVGAMFFGGNQEHARKFMLNGKYVKFMISKSQFNRKLHSIPKQIWNEIFETLAHTFKTNRDKEFLVDSFPIASCHNVRALRSKIYGTKNYFGYVASKKEFFYGVRVHMLTTVYGKPVEFLLKPGSVHDSKAFKDMNIKLPRKSVIYADSAYLNRKVENSLFKKERVLLLPQRRANSKNPMPPATEKMRKKKRKMIETAFSLLEKLLPRSIHAVTKKGFELKITNFVIAMAILFMC